MRMRYVLGLHEICAGLTRDMLCTAVQELTWLPPNVLRQALLVQAHDDAELRALAREAVVAAHVVALVRDVHQHRQLALERLAKRVAVACSGVQLHHLDSHHLQENAWRFSHHAYTCVLVKANEWLHAASPVEALRQRFQLVMATQRGMQCDSASATACRIA